MSHPLQAKDDQWRNRKANASVPVFDPGLSPPGTDEEAGGAHAPAPSAGNRERPPLPATPGASPGRGLRAPPALWYAAAAVLALVILIFGLWSFAG